MISETALATPINDYGTTPPGDKLPMSACEGDCDNDADCTGSLKCFQREATSDVVPGCASAGYVKSSSDHDYCYDETHETTTAICTSCLSDATIQNAVNSWFTGSPSSKASVQSTYGIIENWDVSEVTTMRYLFDAYTGGVWNGLKDWTGLPGDSSVSNWNVSKVQNFFNTFSNQRIFNGDLSKWNTGSATDMTAMFDYNQKFNSDISKWQTGKVTTMKHMLLDNQKFNRDVSKWDVSNVVDMEAMICPVKRDRTQDMEFKQGVWCSESWMTSPWFEIRLNDLPSRCNEANTCGAAGSFKWPTNSNGVFCCYPGHYLAAPIVVGVKIVAADVCKKCPVGQVQPEYSLVTSCTQCERNMMAPAEGLPACAACPSGTFTDSVNDQCKTCGAGQYMDSSSALTVCKECDTGFYTHASGMESCSACPTGWSQKHSAQPFCVSFFLFYFFVFF